MNARNRILVATVLLSFALPATASAASVTLRPSPARVGVGDIVRVDILLTSAVPTNAFAGTLSYPGTLEPVAISDGNSLVNLWVTHPAVPASGAPIAFAGITPGGFSGDTGVLFSVLFRATAAGSARVSLADLQVLRNDGTGSTEPTTALPLVLSIGPKPLGGYAEPADAVPPEAFTASLGNDPQVFGGKNYLVFAAVDKGSGVDHYVIAESRIPSFLFSFFPLSWRTATSPYLLADQDLASAVYVKVIDRAGNERLSVFPPQHLFTLYEKTALLVILVIVVLLWKSRWGRRPRKNL